MPWQDHEAREHVSRIEAMLARLDALADPAARAQALGAVQALVELYGECLARIMRQVTESADGAPAAAIAGDELVSHLLLGLPQIGFPLQFSLFGCLIPCKRTLCGF